MRKGNKVEVKGRKSIISIIIIVLIIGIAAFLTIKYLENREDKKEEDKPYISHLDEEDMMLEEYSKINAELNSMYAFAIYENYLVAVKGKEEFINIIEIDPLKEYDYLYSDTKLYLLEKESGIVSIVSLKTDDGYSVENTINLECKVDSFEVYNKEIFFISNEKLYKYSGAIGKQELESNVTSKNLIIKNEEIYFVKQNNLIKQDMQKNQTQLAQNVNEIYYYNYYERNKLVYDVQYDESNVFKNIYNFYTGEIYNSVKNNTYFIPYNSSEYIYLANDKKSLMKIAASGSSKYLLNSEVEIEEITFLKEGVLLVKKADGDVTIKINNAAEESNDNIIVFHNIKYLK